MPIIFVSRRHASASIPIAVCYHHAKAGFRALHLCILLQKTSILNLRVTIAELVLLLRLLVLLTTVTTFAKVISIFFVLNDRLDLVVLVLTVTRVILSVAER